jgi:transposase
MSLKRPFPTRIPVETARFVEPLLAEARVYRFVGQAIDQLISDEDFADLDADEGRPGVNPVLLALVTVFQFLEKLPDRMAAQMAVMRLDWKYALRQELAWRGFHYADLCNLRKRLRLHPREQRLFERVVDYLPAQGYIAAGGQQRTDSTHLLGAVRSLSTVDLVRETLDVTLRALSSTDAPWTLGYLPASFVETYAPRQRLDWKGKAELAEQRQRIAQDGEWLLEQAKRFGTPALQGLAEVQTLRRVLNEQFHASRDTVPFTPTGHSRGNYLVTPHDLDARRSTKRTSRWVGYKLHVTETMGKTRFITDVVLTPAPEPDNQPLQAVQARLRRRNVRPSRQDVDQESMSAANLAHSRANGLDLRGRLLEDTSGKQADFRLQDFQVNLARRVVVCPAGRQATRFVPAKPKPPNLVDLNIFFGKQCQRCPLFGPDQCTDKPGGRRLGVSQHQALIQARRPEARTDAFTRQMRLRIGIERGVSELVRGHGARRARYRGQRKNALQQTFIAAAANLKRLALVRLLCFRLLLSTFGLSSSQFFNKVFFRRTKNRTRRGRSRSKTASTV